MNREAAEVVVLGAGQAGLATSHELTGLGVEHVVLDRGRVGESWRRRWDTFCLVTPNHTLRLPGHPYAGDQPDGYMPRDEIVGYLEDYARKFDAPVRPGVEALALSQGEDGRLALSTSAGDLEPRAVIVSTGAYQRPHRPDGATTIPASTPVIDAEDYRNPAGLPAGAVLVVGSGQTGCQLAEEILESGREVFLACGRAPWMPRRVDGVDVITRLLDTPFFDLPVEALASPTARLTGNPQASGHHGGRDLHYRTLQASGVRLLGRFTGADETNAYFAPDLAESVAFGDARYREIRDLVQRSCEERGEALPAFPDPPPFEATAPTSLPLQGIGVVIFTSGFRPDYRRWIHFDAFDEQGFPLHRDGASTSVKGLYFVGVHFLRKRKSSLLMGVGDDAALVAAQVADQLAA